MKHNVFIVNQNQLIAKNTMKMVLQGDTSAITKAGQFVNIKIEGLFFIGEVLDVTGRLGGFNLHWAWASAYLCAQALKKQ